MSHQCNVSYSTRPADQRNRSTAKIDCAEIQLSVHCAYGVRLLSRKEVGKKGSEIVTHDSIAPRMLTIPLRGGQTGFVEVDRLQRDWNASIESFPTHTADDFGNSAHGCADDSDRQIASSLEIAPRNDDYL